MSKELFEQYREREMSSHYDMEYYLTHYPYQYEEYLKSKHQLLLDEPGRDTSES